MIDRVSKQVSKRMSNTLASEHERELGSQCMSNFSFLASAHMKPDSQLIHESLKVRTDQTCHLRRETRKVCRRERSWSREGQSRLHSGSS